MWQDSYGITKGQSILVNCPECVSREIEKKKKQLEADFKAAEEEGPKAAEKLASESVQQEAK